MKLLIEQMFAWNWLLFCYDQILKLRPARQEEWSDVAAPTPACSTTVATPERGGIFYLTLEATYLHCLFSHTCTVSDLLR
jgi:hypothetical protein